MHNSINVNSIINVSIFNNITTTAKFNHKIDYMHQIHWYGKREYMTRKLY